MKYLVIANPAAGKGSGRLLIPKLQERLQSQHISFDLVQTERLWHAAELARAAALDGYGAIIAAGGDGTCNEVLNGLMQARRPGKPAPCLGVICIGRGNDFAYGAGLSTNWEAGCRALITGARRAMDIGHVQGSCTPDGSEFGQQPSSGSLQEGRFFGNGVGIGFDASVNIQASQTRLSGFLGYVVAALRTILLHFHSPLVEIQSDDLLITQPSLMISVMNGRRLGGGFLMAPESATADGLLDVCIALKVSRPTILMMIPRFLQGTQGTHPAIRFTRTRRVTVKTMEGGLPVHVDGETICTEARQLDIHILPGALEVIGHQGSAASG